tara:strand:- start:488 stop:715 length:228 start_codon:yes stop_codon:yes gene_type:complete
MLRQFKMNDPQYIRDLADAGIITEAQKQVYTERLRLYRENLQKKVAELSVKNNSQNSTDSNSKSDVTSAPQATTI